MIKRGRITLEQATTAIEIYEQIPLTLVDVDLKQALEIVGKHKVYAYDAYICLCLEPQLSVIDARRRIGLRGKSGRRGSLGGVGNANLS